MILVGNKCDLFEEESVEQTEPKKFAKEIKAFFQLTSALSGFGINKIFHYIGCKILDPKYIDEDEIENDENEENERNNENNENNGNNENTKKNNEKVNINDNNNKVNDANNDNKGNDETRKGNANLKKTDSIKLEAELYKTDNKKKKKCI